ncbi:MAG: hypothetical protein M1818_004528 [Claussenomyces sp. TS43310]|nr:MAG: hypothetical protein M1818_004528 [Claussenomyces sp. TS43310]
MDISGTLHRPYDNGVELVDDRTPWVDDSQIGMPAAAFHMRVAAAKLYARNGRKFRQIWPRGSYHKDHDDKAPGKCDYRISRGDHMFEYIYAQPQYPHEPEAGYSVA